MDDTSCVTDATPGEDELMDDLFEDMFDAADALGNSRHGKPVENLSESGTRTSKRVEQQIDDAEQPHEKSLKA
jgi:hypothetical protein